MDRYRVPTQLPIAQKAATEPRPELADGAATPPGSRLDLEAKLYQRSIWPSVTEVAGGGKLKAPLVVDLDPTTFCDLACPECISGQLLNKGRFSDERLEELARELVEAGVRAVILIGGGEPLAHPGTWRALSVFGPAGVAIGVVTNGTQIHRNVDLLARYAHWVRVSMDAGTSETYGKFRPDRRGRSRFDDVVANMRLLAERRQGSLGYSFLLMTRTNDKGETTDTNFLDVAEAGRLARDIGCDYFELKAMFDMDHFIIEQPPELLAALEAQVEELSELQSEDFEVVASSTLTALRTGAPPAQAKHYSRCPISELRTLLTPSGAYICPYHRGNPDAKLGDPVTQSFEELWGQANGDKVNPAKDCRFHCARHDSNLAIQAIGEDQARRPVREDFDPFI